MTQQSLRSVPLRLQLDLGRPSPTSPSNFPKPTINPNHAYPITPSFLPPSPTTQPPTPNPPPSALPPAPRLHPHPHPRHQPNPPTPPSPSELTPLSLSPPLPTSPEINITLKLPLRPQPRQKHPSRLLHLQRRPINLRTPNNEHPTQPLAQRVLAVVCRLVGYAELGIYFPRLGHLCLAQKKGVMTRDCDL